MGKTKPKTNKQKELEQTEKDLESVSQQSKELKERRSGFLKSLRRGRS